MNRTWRVMLGLSALGVPTWALATPTQGPSATFTGRDLFDLSAAADVQISPDGRQIAYVRVANDIMTDRAQSSIWMIDVASGRQQPLITAAGAHSPRWSPDGTRLAYVSSDGDTSQMFIRWLASGASARITSLPDSPSSVTWSPDGRQIAYVMTVPDEAGKLGKAPPKPEGAKWAEPLQVIDKLTYRSDDEGYLKEGWDHIFVVNADGGAPRQVTFGAWNDGGPISWTPDGHSILFSAVRKGDWQRTFRDSDIIALDLTSGTLKPLTKRNGPDQNPAISPDGRLIAFTGSDDTGRAFDQDDLYVMNRDGSGVRKIAPTLDRSIDELQWAQDSRSLVVSYEQDGGKRVSRITLDGRVTSLATGLVDAAMDRPYAGGAFSLAKTGAVAFTSGDPAHPADVSIESGGTTRRLTRLNDDFLTGKRLGEVRSLEVRAPNGSRVPTWLVTPPGYVAGKRVPLILEIHGGPYASYGPQFSSDDQLYAAAGYAVLYANPQGSTGYGQAFANGIDKNYPGTNITELNAAVDAAVAEGVADPNNLFVTGGSGGGFLTAWMVGSTDRFRAAAAQKPVVNWLSMSLTSDGGPYQGRYWLGKMPWEDPQGNWAHSPLSVVGKVKTPTLVIVGSQDYRTPVSESEQLYTALQVRGVPTALIKVPGANHHGLAGRPSQSAAKASAIIAWFNRYRNPQPVLAPSE
jgi:dipeptidyl aminopeptidase/acylaminoacyl peptidase